MSSPFTDAYLTCIHEMAMGTPQEWLIGTGKPGQPTALPLIEPVTPKPQWSSHTSDMNLSSSSGSLLHWRFEPVSSALYPIADTGELEGLYPTTTMGKAGSHVAQVYVGQTCQKLDHRLKEHRRALTSGSLSQTGIAEHAAHELHIIDWEIKVVDTHPHYHQRCSLELLHIMSEITTMNRDDGNLYDKFTAPFSATHATPTPHTRPRYCSLSCILSPTVISPFHSFFFLPPYHH